MDTETVKQINNLSTINAAEEHLKQNGLSFDRAVYALASYCNPITGETLKIPSKIFVYFMKENTDIAYYCVPLHSLIIHGIPREWSKEFLVDLIDCDKA